MKVLKRKDLLLLIIPLLIIAIAYPFLPNMIPRQFGFNGQVNSYMRKEFLFLVGIVPYAIFKYYQFKKKNS